MDAREYEIVFKEVQDPKVSAERLMELSNEKMVAIRIMVALHPNATNEVAERCASFGDVPMLLEKRAAGVTQKTLLGHAEVLANQKGFSFISHNEGGAHNK